MNDAKFYAVTTNRQRPILVDGDRMETDDSFLYVYSEDKLTAIIDRGIIVYAYFSRQGGYAGKEES
jgi:hypothetical protein